MIRLAIASLIFLSTIPAFAWDGFPLRYNMDTNIVSWAELESTLGVSSQLWYAARERNIAGNENQYGGYGWNETHTYLYEIATSNVVYTDGLTWTNSTTNTWLVYSNSVVAYSVDGYPIGDNELGSYEITNAVWTNSIWIHPPVAYHDMALGVDSLWEKDGSDDTPYEFYVEWLLSTNNSVTLNEYFGTIGEPTTGNFSYPGIPYQTPDGAWARHTLGYRTNNIVTTNAWGLITDNGTSSEFGSGVTKIPMPLKLAEVRWIPDLYLDGYPEFGGAYEGEYVWDEDDQGWNRAAAFLRIVGFYTNGVWKYVGLETGAGAHVFVGDQLGVSNSWVATDAYTNIAGDTASMIVSYTNTGVWQFHEVQPLFDATEGFLRPYTGTPEIVYSGSTNLSPVVTIQGSILTNWNNNPFGIDTSAEDTATVKGGTNRYTLSGEETWQRITNILVDTDGLAGESISVTYYAPTNYYLWTEPAFNGHKGSTDHLDEMFRSMNALQWTAIDRLGNLAITSSVPANVGVWTWQGYGWDAAAANVRTNFDYYADVEGIGALAVTSPDPNWAVAQTPTNLVAASAYLIRFTSPTNEYRLGGWKYQFEAEVAGTLTMENLDPVRAEIANWEVEFGSHSETGFISIAASSSETVTWGTLTNIYEGVAHNTNGLYSCGSLSVTVTDGGTVLGNSIFYETSTITHTANSFLLPWVWAKRYSASVVANSRFSAISTNLLAAVSTDREMYLESTTPPIISIVNPDDIPFELSTNFVFAPEVDDLRYDETNMVGMFTLMQTWTNTSARSEDHSYTNGEIGEVIPYGSNVVWDKGWHIKFESSPDSIRGLYLIKWDVDGGFRHGRTNVYDYPLQESE